MDPRKGRALEGITCFSHVGLDHLPFLVAGHITPKKGGTITLDKENSKLQGRTDHSQHNDQAPGLKEGNNHTTNQPVSQ